MKLSDKRLKTVLKRADDFAASLPAGDIRLCLAPMISSIASAIRTTVDFSINTSNPGLGDKLEAEAVLMVEQLDGVLKTAELMHVYAKLHPVKAARQKAGKTTATAMKASALLTKATVESKAATLRAKRTPERKIVSEIMRLTNYSRSTVRNYLPPPKVTLR